MTGGEVITKALVWVSVAGYAAGAGAFALGRGRRAWDVWARAAWTAGCAAMLAHAASAFHFYHGWSHAAAYVDTERQTREVVGLAWGGGLFFNYALLAAWVVDAAWWWRGLAAYRNRPRVLALAWQAFLFFMFFNAAVVFVAGAARWAGLVACAGLCAAWLAGAAATKGRRAAIAQD